MSSSKRKRTKKDGKISAAELVDGLMIYPLEPGSRVEEAFFLLRTTDTDGESIWAMRKTADMSLEELLGALDVQVELARRALRRQWKM